MKNKETRAQQAEVREAMSHMMMLASNKRDMGALNLVIQSCPSAEIGGELRNLFWEAISMYVNSGTMPILKLPEGKNDIKIPYIHG